MAITIPESLEANNRQAVRVPISPKDPVRFAADRKKVAIENISESGLAFVSEEPFEKKKFEGILKFKMDQVYTLNLTVEVLMVVKNSYRCRFVDMTESDEKLMSKLVLGLQKLHIRRRKQQKLAEMERQAAAKEKAEGPGKLEFNFSKKGKAAAKKAEKVAAKKAAQQAKAKAKEK